MSIGMRALAKISINEGIIIVVVGGGIYALDNLLLVLAWQKLLKWFGGMSLSWRTNIGIYGSTQIAKYIPGNIFQLPSRHMRGYQNGLEHAPLLGAAIFEIIGLLIAASLISLIGFLSGIRSAISIITVVLVLFLALASPILIYYLITHVKFLQRISISPKKDLDLLNDLLPVWIIYILFFLIASLILYAIIHQVINPVYNLPVQVVFATFSLAWLAGFITPGAPAGIGVREGVIILILTGYIGEPASIIVSILSRFVTMAGDLCFYLVGLWLGRQDNKKQR
jgi:uncharacterized membrane protein YbhN (UPF0104 family)